MKLDLSRPAALTGRNFLSYAFSALFLVLSAAGTALAQIPTSASLTVGPNPGTLGSDIYLTVTVTPLQTTTLVPTGGVTIQDNLGDSYVAPIVNGSAQLILQPAAGTYQYTAAYDGDSNFAPSGLSTPVTERVEAGTSTAIYATPNPASYGLPVTITATVFPNTATGSVTFYDHTNPLGVAPLVSGSATFTTALLQSGLRSLTARYSGDANNLSSLSGVLTEGVLAEKGLGFGAPQTYSAGTAPNVLAIGNINGDDFADIVVANNGSDNISVFLGNGNGAFQPAINYATGSAPLAIAIGDFNADGYPDVALAGSDGIDILYGSASGLQPFVNVNTTPAAGLAVTDFNLDGIPDLVSVGNAGVNVLISNGNETFQTPISCSTQSALGVGVGDVNGDGIPDIVASNSGGVTVFLGAVNNTQNDAYSCQPGVPYAYGANSQTVLVKDVNGDGNQDIVVGGFGATTVSVLLGVGNGTFNYKGSYPGGAAGVTGLAIADFNGDGIPDVAVSNSSASLSNGLGLFVLLGNGDGSFGAPNGFPSDAGLAGLAAANFNGNGEADIAVLSAVDNHLDVLLNGYPTLTITGGNTQTTDVYNTFLVGLSVNANGFGAIAAHVPVTFTASNGFFDGSGSSAVVMTDGNGNATAPLYTANGVPGADNVTATAGSNTVTFTLTNEVQPCTFVVSPTSLVFAANGGGTTFTVTASASNCMWNADTSFPGVELGNTTGVGSGQVSVLIPQNTTGTELSESLFIAGQTIPVEVDETDQIFADVVPSAYYFDEANLMYEKGITSGCSTTPLDYCPTASVTRAEMAVFIVRSIYGSDNFPYSLTPVFADVPANNTYFPWIQALYALGITTGCSTTPLDYCPNNPVTRAEMAIFIIRARYGASEAFDYPPTPYFTDVPASSFEFAWVQRLKEDNITSGCGPTTYCPNNNVLRQDMAVFIMRGSFNQFLPPTEPIIAGVSPSSIPSGTPTTLTVTGVNTNFVQNETIVNATPNLTFGQVTVTSPTSFTVLVTGTTPSTAVPQSIWVTTGTVPNAQEAVLPNGLTVQ